MKVDKAVSQNVNYAYNPDRRAAPPLIGGEWREFSRSPLYLLIGLGLLLIVLGYQPAQGAHLSIAVGASADFFYLSGFNDGESKGPLTFRWSQDVSLMVVPGVGRSQSLNLTLGLIGSRPTGQPAGVLTVTADSRVVAVLSPRPGPQVYTVTIPGSVNTDDDLSIYFAANAFSPPHDRRTLGVVFTSVQLAASSSSGLALPPISETVWLLLSLLLLFLTLRHLRVSWQPAWALGAALMAVVAALLVLDRYELTIFALPLLVVMSCVYAMAVLFPPVVLWTLVRLRAEPSALALRWLMLIYLLAFAIKAGGMIYPRFIVLDHVLRAHQVQALVADPASFWASYQHLTTANPNGSGSGENTVLGQWHLQVPIPYPPLVYYVLAPFGLLWPNVHVDRLVIACDTTLAALLSTAAFALYAMAKRGMGSGGAGLIAAAIALFAPISYLHFSDGDWTYMWGGWIALVYIMAVVCMADRASQPLPFVILSLLAALAITSHPAIPLFLAVFIALAVVSVLLMKRHNQFSFPLWPLLASFLIGAALSLIYYGAYIVPILTVSLPAIVAHIGKGLGLDQQLSKLPLLTGFWPQIWAHFTAWPFILAICGLILLLAGRVQHKVRPIANDGTERFFTAIAVAWAGMFALFSIVDLKANLLQRHMMFALPLLGLLAGYALVRLAQYQPASLKTNRQTVAGWLMQRWPVLLVGGLIGFLFVIGWESWLARVLNYVLPPGSG